MTQPDLEDELRRLMIKLVAYAGFRAVECSLSGDIAGAKCLLCAEQLTLPKLESLQTIDTIEEWIDRSADALIAHKCNLELG